MCYFEGLQTYQEFKRSHSEKELRAVLSSLMVHLQLDEFENIKADVVHPETGDVQDEVSCSIVPVDSSVAEPVKVYVSADDMVEIMSSDCLAAKIMRLMYLANVRREDGGFHA